MVVVVCGLLCVEGLGDKGCLYCVEGGEREYERWVIVVSG